MKKYRQMIIIPLLAGLLLAGCQAQADKLGGSQEPAQENKDANDVVKNSGPSAEEILAEQQAKLLAEREALEKQRREELGEFYAPLPPLGTEGKPKPVEVKALYITANVAGFSFAEEDVDYYAEYIRAKSGQSGKPADGSRMAEINKLEKALAICNSTEVNALVIDIKNDDGLVAWKSDIGIVNRIGSNWTTPLKNYDHLMAYLKKKDIYTIARVVAFKDPYFAKKEAGHAILLKTGGVYRDRAGMAWVNPFDPYIWKYLVAVSREAALRGFHEVQFDYVRFPDGAKTYNPLTEFPGRNGQDKDEGIAAFLEYARAELKPYPVLVSADVFGILTHNWDDKPEDIGQTWRKIANQVDYICPMIYPSHYGPGLYGFAVPDQHPDEVARLALLEAMERNAAEMEPALIRPWFQAFTATWVRGHLVYDARTVASQMVAARELGIREYILWNASNNYDPMSFFYHARVKSDIRQSGQDSLLRTPTETMKMFLEAEKARRLSTLYLLTPLADRPADYDQFAAAAAQNPSGLISYQLQGVTDKGDGTYTAAVRERYPAGEGTTAVRESQYRVVLENDVYKVARPAVQAAAGE